MIRIPGQGQESPLLSVIVPVFNEEARIANLGAITDYFSRRPFSAEIVVVNDGSTDRTLERLGASSSAPAPRVVSYPQNRGKGYAVKRGMLAAEGRFRLFLDIDLSTPLAEFEKFLPYCGGYGLIIGSRRTAGARLVQRQPFVREILGKGFVRLARVFLGIRVSDVTCGFKCFSREAAERIFRASMIERWAVDAELCFLAKKFGFPIKEVPVTWADDARSQVRLFSALFTSLRDIVLIRVHDLMGSYGRRSAPRS